MLRLSQGQLSLLEYCSRRYQHTILESLSVPSSPELLAAQQWGDRFHLLMQQREMGLPIDPVLQADPELQTCLTQLQTQAPDLFAPTGEIFRQSEHERSLSFSPYRLTGVYDLLRLWRDRAEIVDWKTYLKPKRPDHLTKDWQTRLYLYVLAETTDYPPDAISMTYWFVRTVDAESGELNPQQVRIPYSAAQHEHTRQDLERLTQQLTDLLAHGIPFPQIAGELEKCDRCPFTIRCQRAKSDSDPAAELMAFEEIPEVVI
ncbi:PD-(D/E)XK nuclease family protein [Halomicronema sp. CCY15110]|uniref:PD-(D/E)XK nuclease family protein n=1 Tax=Halomicronema sp. CCY15110 TaxID=2767773 RepID=UPI00195261AE|nr:PD-(D/E)XK nuclease family protein [Halomicronema sp. CCY15110]